MSHNKKLIERRNKALCNAGYYFYDEPLHVVKGEGIWLWDDRGNKYLDCYNNVASVGHCHPHVVEALYKQASTLNTHTRYLHENVVMLAEKLTSTLPEKLSVCAFVCTGTEANDLAVQMARHATGGEGCMVTEYSYHGNSTLINDLSTDSVHPRPRPDWLSVIEPPNTYRGPFRPDNCDDLAKAYAGQVTEGIAGLNKRGHSLAAFMVDTSWDSNGILNAPKDYLKQSAAHVHDAGGLVIADEVQSGYCRMGKHMWGFEHYDIIPDIVTMGKPMGDGHPLAAVVTTPEIAAKFSAHNDYFNTFGGNPVACAVGNAVLEVVENENLLANATDVGIYLGSQLNKLADQHKIIGDFQGSGLFWGIDLVHDRETKKPLSHSEMRRLTSDFHKQGVLVASTGRLGNVLKIRPPLIFNRENADQLLSALDTVFQNYKA